MAQIHVSKDPSNPSAIPFAYVPLIDKIGIILLIDNMNCFFIET